MKKRIKEVLKKATILIVIVLAIALIFTFVNDRPTFADSGFSTSHSSGGSYSGGSGFSGIDSSDIDDFDFELWYIIIVLGIVFIAYIIKLITKGKNEIRAEYQPFVPVQNNIENYIRKYIPNFDRQQFLNMGYRMYCDVQGACMNSNLENVKHLISDEIYKMYQNEITALVTQGKQKIMKEIVLNDSYLRLAKNENNALAITVGYVIEYYDYIVDKNTGNKVKGDANRKKRVYYEIQFRQCSNYWVITQVKTLNQYYI